MSQSQILEEGLRQMECVAGWSCGFGMYSPIQLPVITKALLRSDLPLEACSRHGGLERQWGGLTKKYGYCS